MTNKKKEVSFCLLEPNKTRVIVFMYKTKKGSLFVVGINKKNTMFLLHDVLK